MSRASIRVGIGGWTFEPWRGVFYPAGLPQARELEFAAGTLGAIEINATFYRRQSPDSWVRWAAAAPVGFQYAIKGSRFIVTRPKLADAGEGIANFYAQGLEWLGDKLGPTLWTLARHRKFDRDDIERFLDLLPRTFDGRALRHVIEPRHESFRDPAFVRACAGREVAIAYGDDDDFPLFDADTAPFRYARLQRMREEVATGYDEQSLDRFATLARGWCDNGRDTYLFLINGAKVRAPAAALAIQQRLGIAPARPLVHQP